MKTYTLTKTAKGKKYLYEVKDENDQVVAKRLTARDYVACTINGKHYFGRVDLVGAGVHGHETATAEYFANYTKETFLKEREDLSRYLADEKVNLRFPLERVAEYVQEKREYGKRLMEQLKVVYLSK